MSFLETKRNLQLSISIPEERIRAKKFQVRNEVYSIVAKHFLCHPLVVKLLSLLQGREDRLYIHVTTKYFKHILHLLNYKILATMQ